MKTLIITANPSSKSFTHKIAKRYENIKKKFGNKVEIINLYDAKYKLNFLKFKDVKSDFPENNLIKRLRKKILNSDELVFIFPLWNLAEPAILKNFHDLIFSVRFGFKFVEGKLFPIGLLEGKIANFFVTCDGYSIFYKLMGNPLKLIWKYGRMKVCSIKLKNFIYFQRMLFRDNTAREKYLNKVEKIAMKNYF